MFMKNHLRPALATAGADRRNSGKPAENDAFLFENANTEADDFNAFHTTGRDEAPKRPQPKKGGGISKRTWIIAAIAAAAVLFLAIVIIIVANVANATNGIKTKGNSYIAYADGDGVYHVAVNGKVLETSFEGEVEVTPSLDTSFAYVTENAADGYNIYVLKGTKLELITPTGSVTEILAYADRAPGVIYTDTNAVNLYTEKYGDDRITKNLQTDHYMISADASTIIYTEPVENNASEFELWFYKDGSAERIAKNCYPVAVSGEGDYIYGAATSAKDPTKQTLYVITTKDMEKYPINENSFVNISAMNIKGDEIIYRDMKGTELSTYICRVKKGSNLENSIIAKGSYMPVTIDPEIVAYKTFAGIYVEGQGMISDDTLDGTVLGGTSTYFINKKYEANKISSARGKFSLDGDYFYYINGDGNLIQINLKDKNMISSKVDNDVVDFAVTEKGNVYLMTDEGSLRFYKVSTKKKTRISLDATSISMYTYANTLYFYEEGNDVNVYSTSEGSAKKLAEFRKVPVTGLPAFNTPESKKSFAYFYDPDTGWKLFYTSNGKSFKQVSIDCSAIVGAEEDSPIS